MLQTTQAKPSMAVPGEGLEPGVCPGSPALGADTEAGEHSRSCKTSRAWPKAVGKSPHSLGEPKFHGFQHFAVLSQGLVPLGFEEPTGSTTDSLCLKWALSFPACPTGRTTGKSSMLCSMSQDGPQGRPQGQLGGHGICPIHPYADPCCHLK